MLSLYLNPLPMVIYGKRGDYMVKINENYYIDEKGNVYSNFSGEIKKINPYLVKPKNRKCVDMYGKRYQVHRLVAQTFIPNPENKPFVHHKDLNHLNNSADNLMWVTRKEHDELHKNELSNRKGISPVNLSLTYEQANEIREKYKTKKYSHRQLAKEYGVSKTTIGDLLRGKYYNCKGKCND